MKITVTKHDLTLIPEKYRHIVAVLLKYQNNLSDGYGYYAGFDAWNLAHERYNGDNVLAILVMVAQEILGEGVE